MNDIELSYRYTPLFDLPIAREQAGKNPSDKYWQDLSKVSIVVMTGGRFSVKSFAVSLAQVYWTAEHGYNILSTRYTNSSLEDSVIPEIREKIEMLSFDDRFHIIKNRAVNLVDNSKIVFKGLKPSSGGQSANLKSLKDFSAWWVEEAEEHHSFEQWEKAYFSIRDVKRQVISGLVLNPATKEHWVYKEFFEKRNVKEGFNGIKDEILYIHTTYKDCPRQFIPDNIYNSFERMKVENPKKYQHVVLGGWLDSAEGLVYENWKSIGSVPEGAQLLGYGMDFGFSQDPASLVAIYRHNGTIIADEIVYQTHLTNSELIKLMSARGVKHNVTIWADSAEPKTIHEISMAGYDIRPVIKSPDSIKNGIRLIQDMPEWYVTDASHNIKKELRYYCWDTNKDGKMIDKPIDMYNHALDALRYWALMSLKAQSDYWVV